MVIFLHENRREGCTTAAVDNAASGGHLELLKFLCHSRAEGGTVYAMILAAWHGHLEVVKWLHENREEVGVCVSSGREQSRQQYICDPSLHIDNQGAEAWCQVEALQALQRPAAPKFFFNHAPFSRSRLFFLRSGFVGLHPCQGCTSSAMNGAAYNSHLEVVRWLHENRTEVMMTR